MTEAERASKAWMNMLGALPRKGFFSGRTERQAPKPREYRWYELADGRRVFRPAVQHTDSKRAHLPAPQISPDYAAYDCPVTGRMIEGRRAHRENLKQHGCRVLEPGETEQHRRERPRQKEAALNKAIEDCTMEAAKELFV